MLTYEEKKTIVKMRWEGYMPSAIAARFHITTARVQQLVQTIGKFGVRALMRRKPKRLTPSLANRIIGAYGSGESALDVAHRFGVSTTTVWDLASGRIRYDSPERGKRMSKKKKDKVREKGKKYASESEEVRQLKEENEYLRTENAYLKKLKALAQAQSRKSK